MNKITQELITMLNNRLSYLAFQREVSVRLGNIEQVSKIDEDISSVEATLLLLNASS